MLDIIGLVGTIQRPKLLVRSAKFGVDEYRRDIHLPRLLKTIALPRFGEAVMKLIEIEAEMEYRRQEDRADYSFAKHIEVLIALMGEVRLYRETSRVLPHLVSIT